MRAKIFKNYWLLTLLFLPFIASSCSKEEDVAESNDYCYIKSVTLGNVKRQIASINTTFAGSSFEMTINLRDNTIENRDSLPYGSQLSAVTANIVFDGSTLMYRPKFSNSEWTSYNSTDSLDLTRPLELYLTSNDKLSSRIYTFKVNVHKQEGDSLYWRKCESNVSQLTGLSNTKAFVLNDKLMVLGNNGTSIILAERSGIEVRGTWEENTTDMPLTADLQTLRQLEGTLYLSTSDGKILSSSDAKTWNQEGSDYSAPLTLIEKTKDFFYAISVSKNENKTICKLLRSTDATTWEEDKLDSETTFLPAYAISALSIQQANGNKRIVLIGQRDSDESEEEDATLKNAYKNALVWYKMWNDGWKAQEKDAEWIYFPVSPDNTIPCPRLKYFNLLPYDGKCIAFGGASLDESHKALDVMYVSQDYGVTWRPSTTIRMPAELKGTDGCITSTIDDNNFIWIITNSQVWRGRLNRLGFAQQ